MALVSQIITDAYQYNNLVALGVIPNAAEQAKGLRYLNRIFKGILGNELGYPLTTYKIGTNNISQPDLFDDTFLATAPYRIPRNARVVLNLTSPTTAFLTPSPKDGDRLSIQDLSGNIATNPLTINGNGYRIQTSLSLTLNTNNLMADWFFRADKGDWYKISNLELTDAFPLPEEFEEYFITMLAIRLGASEGVELNSQLTVVLRDGSRKLRSRYNPSVEMSPEKGLLYTSGVFPYYSYFNTGSSFRF